jgi:hypothetical protein
VSSYYYLCVLILLYVSSYCFVSVLILLWEEKQWAIKMKRKDETEWREGAGRKYWEEQSTEERGGKTRYRDKYYMPPERRRG